MASVISLTHRNETIIKMEIRLNNQSSKLSNYQFINFVILIIIMRKEQILSEMLLLHTLRSSISLDTHEKKWKTWISPGEKKNSNSA